MTPASSSKVKGDHKGMTRHRWLAAVAVAGMLAAACGQKTGVHVSASGGGANAGGFDTSGLGGGSADTGTAGVATTLAGGPSGGVATSGSSSSGTATGSAAAAKSSGGATTGSAPAASGGGGTAAGGTSATTAAAAKAGDRTGVSDSEIRIGIHAPATGAGAPAPSFDAGKQVYFNFIGNGVNGRKVTVFFEDDGYNPSQAVAACKKLVEQDKVFLLIGGGGTDQIVACAQYAATVGVPYLAEGVTEKGMSNLPNYFAESMTYKAQGVLLAQYIKHVVGKTDVAMVRGDTANFDDAHTGFITAAQQLGLNVKKDITTNKDGNTAATDAANVCAAIGGPTGAANAVVYPLMSPKAFITFASAAAQQQCFPRYAGIGITLGLNVVAQALCPVGAFRTGATFFSPYQGLDAADPEYQKAYQAQNGQAGDDIGYALWGLGKLLTQELIAGGKDLTRQSFVAGLQGKSFNTGVFPMVNYSNTRFGGTAVHVLKADCSKSQYVTESQNKSGF
jgi:ABC-type branched-subunit amino acid transport system substrate-binding protein